MDYLVLDYSATLFNSDLTLTNLVLLLLLVGLEAEMIAVCWVTIAKVTSVTLLRVFRSVVSWWQCVMRS